MITGARSQVHGAAIIRENAAGYLDVSRPVLPTKGPDVRIRLDMMNDADVLREITRLRRDAVALNIARRRDDDARGNPDPARNDRRFRDLAHPHRQIEPVLNHIAELVVRHEFNPERGLFLSAGRA